MTQDNKARVAGFIIIIAAFIIAFLLSGCMTPKKATNYLKEKGMLDDSCAANYPAIADTIIKEGEVVERVEVWLDTLYVVDTVQDFRTDTLETVKVITRKVTRTRVDTLVQTKIDSAAVSALRGIIAAKVSEHAKISAIAQEWKDKAKNRSRNQFISIAANILLLLAIGFILGKKLKLPKP